MGCQPSKRRNEKRLSSDATDQENNKLAIRALLPSPTVTVTIGSGVQSSIDLLHTIIFIFGGPGSHKGVLTQELAHEFDFTLINVEDIVFTYLPNKVANTVSSVVEIQELLKKDSNVLTLEWILNMISMKLSTSNSQRFIIDIVPELMFILRADTYHGADHEKKMENFERKHPIFCAFELFVSGEEAMYEVKNENSDIRNELNTKELSPELTAFVKGIDEADKGRLEKRIFNYHKCARPFLRYFQKTRRSVKFDLKIPHNPEIINAVRKTLTEFGFARNNDFIRTVLFMTKDNIAEEIDLPYYRLTKVYLSDICYDKNETLSQQIRAVRKYIYRTAQHNENFLVILNCLNNTDYPLTKRINFTETVDTYLDYFIRHREPRVPSVRCKMPFRAISTTTDELCLFPKTMNEALCNKIGFIFNEKLTFSESNSLAPSRLSNSPEDRGLSLTSLTEVPRRLPTPMPARSANASTSNSANSSPTSSAKWQRRRSVSMGASSSTDLLSTGEQQNHQQSPVPSSSNAIKTTNNNNNVPAITLTNPHGFLFHRNSTVAPKKSML